MLFWHIYSTTEVIVDMNFPVKVQIQASNYSDYCSDVFSSQAAVSSQMKTWISSVTMFLLGSPTKTLLGRSVCFSNLGSEQSSDVDAFISSIIPFKGHYLLKLRETSSWSKTLSPVRLTI